MCLLKVRGKQHEVLNESHLDRRLFVSPMLSLWLFSQQKAHRGRYGDLLEEVARASNRQPDLKLIREGMPAYLMLMMHD